MPELRAFVSVYILRDANIYMCTEIALLNKIRPQVP